jgi:TonB-linked SusC/RagA family outer membrane protein
MKKFINLIVLVTLIISFSQLHSQTRSVVSGKVVDQGGKPLAKALVLGDEGDVFTYSDDNGEFSIEIIFSDVLLVEKDGFGSKQVNKNSDGTKLEIILQAEAYLEGEKDFFYMPFRKLAQKRTTGSVNKVDVRELEKIDSRQGRDAALDGKIAGLIGSLNSWGRGNSIIVVDGVPRTNNYEFWLREVETITVLKDALTRSMFGVEGDQGVIMITTRRGKAYKKELNVQVEYGVDVPVENSLPKYMNAADYMETVNTVIPNSFTASKISDTRNGVDPKLNPDINFFSKQFIKPQKTSRAFFADASGGNSQGQYYLNMGWENYEGWMNTGAPDNRNKFNLRANLDYKLTNSFKMRLDASALFDIQQGPNITDFWQQANSILPNSYPLTWDPNLITDDVTRQTILRGATLVDGELLGGNRIFSRNIYGDLKRNGKRISTERYIQVNLGADWDLKSILPGLKAGGQFSVDAYNNVVRAQSAKYIVYNPVITFTPFGGRQIGVDAIGEDVFASNMAVQGSEMQFQRKVSVFANLTYDKTFGKTDVSLMGVAYGTRLMFQNASQDIANVNYGVNGNIMHNKKFLFDFSSAFVGTQKLAPGNRYALNYSFGLGYILSEENFMKGSKVFDFLKIKATTGLLNNDSWQNYFLYSEFFATGQNFSYNNGQNSNRELNYVSRQNNIGFQKRREYAFGIDAAMFKKKVWFEANVFQSESFDLVTEMQNSLPLILGTQNVRFFQNFNANVVRGLEFGLKYEKTFNKFSSLSFGTNFITVDREITKIDEPLFFPNSYQFRNGTDPNSWFGLKSNGLYGVSDFDAAGNLLKTLPQPAFGQVAPGDIKYVDKNGDGVINSNDEHIIAQNDISFQASFFFNLKFKQWDLFGVASGSFGDYNNRSGNYQRVSGNTIKYPEHLKDAYSATNPDTNAIYPRLTAVNSLNNNRTSDFWLYKNNTFSFPALQLTYNFTGKGNSALRGTRIYLRGTDLLRIDPNSVFNDVRTSGLPRTRSFVLGSVFKF